MRDKKNILFVISLGFTILFICSPILLKIPTAKYIVTGFLRPLSESGYKSSYIESLSGIIGTVLAITGTLYLQGKIDEREDKEKKKKEERDIRCRIIVVYYDLKLCFQDISNIYLLIVANAFLNEENKVKNFYDAASKIELYIDTNWIRNVASLHEVFDEKTLESIFLIYGDISAIKNGLKSDDRSNYQTFRLVSLISKFFSGIPEGEPQLANKYVDLLEILKERGKIEIKE